MTTLYADVNHVEQAFDKIKKDDSISYENTVTIDVFVSKYVMRGIERDVLRKRNISGNPGTHVCSFKYDGVELTLSVHQKFIEGEFTLNPASTDAIDAQQASSPREVCPTIDVVLDVLENEHDVFSYDFTEVSAGSIATGGHFTGFVFKWVATGF
jgi:hypothetical protein